MTKYHPTLLVSWLVLGWVVACSAVSQPIPLPTVAAVATIPVFDTPTALATVTQTAVSTPSPLPPTVTILPSATPTTDILLSMSNILPTATTLVMSRYEAVLLNGRSLPLTPGDPQPYLTQFRLVTYYGHPNTPVLGILGQGTRDQIAEQLHQTATEYQALWPAYQVMPTLHFISTIADPIPGEFNHYSHQTDLETLRDWITFADEQNMAFILDIQPGHADIKEEFERIRPFLYHPHVHLALDPEFTMTDTQIPGLQLGQLHANQINTIQAELNTIANDIGLHKLLIIHQFETSMVQQKELILDYPYVELVIDADGFGSPEAKIGDLQQYAAEPGWEYAGLKLFFAWDTPLLTPTDVLTIQPQPVVIIYQ